MKKHAHAIALLLVGFVFAVGSTPTIQARPAPVKQDPNVIHITSAPEQGGDIADQIKRLLAPTMPEFNPFNDADEMVVNRTTNTFYLYKVTSGASDAFEKESNMMAINGVKEITINLHSPGGEITAAYVITQQIKILNEKGVKVKTIVEDKNACMSACPYIFLAGNEKIAFANSVFMLHSPYIQFPYNTPEPIMEEYMRELRADRDRFAKQFQDACPADKTIAMDMYDHDNHFYRADELDKRCPKTFFDSIIPVIDQDHPAGNTVGI